MVNPWNATNKILWIHRAVICHEYSGAMCVPFFLSVFPLHSPSKAISLQYTYHINRKRDEISSSHWSSSTMKKTCFFRISVTVQCGCGEKKHTHSKIYQFHEPETNDNSKTVTNGIEIICMSIIPPPPIALTHIRHWWRYRCEWIINSIYWQ